MLRGCGEPPSFSTFFETLVRIHRAGEGAPYTGLTDEAPEPIIAATDGALATGSPDDLEQQLVGAVKAGLAERFAAARAARSFQPGDVANGRTYVAAYVSLTHWVEGTYGMASGAGEHHAPGAEPAEHHATSVGAIEHHAIRDGRPTALHDELRASGTSEGAEGSRAQGDLRQHLPWIAAGFLAVLALIKGAFLLKWRPHGTG